MEKKLQKIYIIHYSLLIAQGLWQAHYQILSIIFLKKFTELTVHPDMMIENMKLAELNINCDCFLEYTHFKDGLIENKCFACNENYQQKFDEKLKEQFFNTDQFF